MIEPKTVTYKGQIYSRKAETIDHVRLDGEPTKLAVWVSECPKCAKAFEVTTPLRAARPDVRHCPEHRRRRA